MNLKKTLAVQKTVYPLDYDKNNPRSDKGFNQFQKHVRETLKSSQLPAFKHENN